VKIDHEYLKGILEAFEDEEGPQTDIRKLKIKGYDCDSAQFVFHMRLLDDRRLICQSDGSRGFGLQESADGFFHWAVVPLRLTAAGHDFIEALRNKEVWSTVKSGFKDASMGTLVDVSKKLLEGYVQKKIDNLLN
jgi:hypothetical protein